MTHVLASLGAVPHAILNASLIHTGFLDSYVPTMQGDTDHSLVMFIGFDHVLL